jgi:acetoin utilization deacetylase AcuC-like enzyme
MPRKTGIVADRRYLLHSAGLCHPESPQRLAEIHEMLDNPAMSWKFTQIEAREATHDEIAIVHSLSYINFIASTAGKDCVMLDPDTMTSPDTYCTAKLAVGGACNAVDQVLSGSVDNAFAFVRPPGHHAGKENAAGFCIFNNIAIAAMHAILKHRLKRVMIVDWDLHHGNGTQGIFYKEPRVLYFSTHQYPYYPGTGSMQEIGHGKGEGYTINVPIQAGASDASYVKVFSKILEPVALEYNPQLILLSAGFDAYFKDPLGGMRITPEGFAALARILLNIANKCCKGRFVAVLEGGYHVAGLAKSAKCVLEEMLDENHFSQEKFSALNQEMDENTDRLIRQVTSTIRPFWNIFKEGHH